MTMMNINDVHKRKAQQLVKWNRYDDAMKEALAIIQNNPDDPEAYAFTSYISVQFGQNDSALYWAEESLRRDPNQVLARFSQTAAYFQMRKYKKALAAMKEAQRIDPFEPFYNYIQAEIFMKRGFYGNARIAIVSALKLNPSNAYYLAKLSYIEAVIGNMDVSRIHAKESLRMQQESGKNLLVLAKAAERRGEKNDHAQLLEQAIRLKPDHSHILITYKLFVKENHWLLFFHRKPKPWLVVSICIILSFVKYWLGLAFFMLYLIFPLFVFLLPFKFFHRKSKR
ncbi:tetratricopeptide repeat protein [Paenibacillus sp. LHD-117]|uniref:tetratricopeptide repeat protein n=1 Tax=Paenibacillus sp. LHD-117 TaxID=3071412 RepID=UPI0027E16D62|nr:tetratricopeptide repeat protein [Paenibacillus sp. LHD-117]MDQ6420732.1 tetratricopeptide repeat protein [Paenibacillus sp. LHD-117]